MTLPQSFSKIIAILDLLRFIIADTIGQADEIPAKSSRSALIIKILFKPLTVSSLSWRNLPE
jgi:hypothetical protein